MRLLSDLERGPAFQFRGRRRVSRKRQAFSLSTAQLGIWFAQQITPGSAAYNIGEWIEIHGSIDPQLFEQALRRVILEAEALRLHFSTDEDIPSQRIGPLPAWSMPFIDLSGKSDAHRLAEAWMLADLGQPMDLAQGRLFKFALFQASPDVFYWYARYHHLVMDGLSMWLIARRVADLYSSLLRRTDSADHAFGTVAALVDQDAAYRISEDFSNDREFWKSHLGNGPEPIRLGSKLRAQSKAFVRHTAYLPRSTTDQLRLIAKRAGTGFAQVVAAGTAVFLHRVSGKTEFIFGLPLSNRTENCRATPGMASNVLPLCLAVRPDMTFVEVVEQTKHKIKEVIQHQRFPTSELRNFQPFGSAHEMQFGVS